MTKEQAIQIIVNALSLVKATLAEHQQIQTALKLLLEDKKE
jgi:hypothetical protein